MRWLRFSALLLLLVTSIQAAELNISAASSLQDAMTEIGKLYETRTGTHVALNFAGSNTLVLQIRAGAPADVFMSADEAKMNELEHDGLLASGTRKPLLSNSLVVVVPSSSSTKITSAQSLADSAIKRIAIGQPNGVPAGIYARLWLQHAGVWSAIEKKSVPVENVRAALALVEKGNVDAAIVYETDALTSKDVRVAFRPRGSAVPSIVYPVAVVRATKHLDEAKRFVAFLGSADAIAVFSRYGFPLYGSADAAITSSSVRQKRG